MLNSDDPAPVDYSRDLGPRPQIWLPDSTADVDRLSVMINQTGAVSPLGTPTIYSWTPLALAVPKGLDTVPVPGDWRASLEAYAGAGFDIVRPDSNASVIGQLSLTVTYPRAYNWGAGVQGRPGCRGVADLGPRTGRVSLSATP